MVISFLGSILALRLYFLGKPNLLNLANLALHVRTFFEQIEGEKMKLRIVLLLLFLLTSFASTIASAETETTVSDDAESFNLAGYIILGFAIIGWGFFLLLLGWAIWQIIKKAKNPYIAKNPVKCK